jgi:N-sulfoglucosamine sulfohydrolase
MILHFVQALLWAGLAASSLAATAQPPNILVFTVDDMDAFSIQFLSRAQPGLTPNLDRLASEGTLVANAHVPAPTCGPSRHSFITGLHPHQNGSYGFYKVSGEIPSLSSLLGKAGYFTAVIGKLRDYDSFPWDYMPPMSGVQNWNNRKPDAHAREVKAAIVRARRAGKPFFIACNTSDPHRPFPGSQQELDEAGDGKSNPYPAMKPFCSAGEVVLPGYLPDLPEIREEYAQYLTAVRRADESLQAVLQVLQGEDVADNTIVIFYSDHGASFPTAKGEVLWHSTHAPLVVRWPGHIPAGVVNSTDLVNVKDLMPTLLDVAGAPLPQTVEGNSLLPLLTRQDSVPVPRQSVFTTWNFFVAGKHYRPCRGVHTDRYSLVFNALADGQWTAPKGEPTSGMTWPAMVTAAKSDPEMRRRVDWFRHRDRIELFDREKDPWSLNNVADDPDYASILNEMMSRMEKYMRSTSDPLIDAFLGTGPVPPHWAMDFGWDIKKSQEKFQPLDDEFLKKQQERAIPPHDLRQKSNTTE